MDELKQKAEQIENWENISMRQQPDLTSVQTEGPNTCQQFLDSAYPRNHQTLAGCNSASVMARHSDQTTFAQFPALHQSRNPTLVDQLMPGNLTQAIMPFGTLQASSESTSQADFTNPIDWVNQAYQKILQMKAMHLSKFIFFHNKMQELKLRETDDAERLIKWERNRVFLDNVIRLLNVSKSQLLHLKMERVCLVMNDAMKYLSHVRHSNILYLKQVDASRNHIEATHVHQQRESHPQLNSAPAGLHQQHPSNSYNVGSPAQYNLMRRRPTRQRPPRMGGSQIGSNPRTLLLPSGRVDQCNNWDTLQPTVASSRNIFNSVDYSINPSAQTPVLMPLQNNLQDQAMMRQKMMQPAQQLMADKNEQQKSTEDRMLRRFVRNNQIRCPVPPPNSSPYAISPQNSQQFSSLELKDLSSEIPNVATPSLSSASPSALPSPLTSMTPLTPSSKPVDSLKSPLLEESSKLANNLAAASQPPLQDINRDHLATDAQRDQLVEGVMPEVILRDFNFDKGTLNQEHSTGMKRDLVTVPFNDLACDSEFSARANMKRLKTEPNNLLLEEIKEINQKFIETVVDVDVSKLGFDKGTLIRCTYKPVGFSRNVNIPNTSTLMFPDLLLELIVSADYPNSSPTVVEKAPSCYCDGKLWIKAKSNFSESLRKLSMPLSVKDMAEAWDVSARQVYYELAEQMGGGSFSSKYGKWENCGVTYTL